MADHKDLLPYISDTIREHWELLALTDFDGASFQYRDVARKIAKLHILYEHMGLRPGDKVALCGRNSAQWAIAFLATLTYGAVAVPILHDFKADNVHHLVCHSGAKLFFVDRSIWENLDHESMPDLKGVLYIGDYSLLFSRSRRLTDARNNLNRLFGERYPERFTPDDVYYESRKPGELAIINYTSGSTGFSKGVMLTYHNLWSNLQFARDHLTFLHPGDGVICMLPLAHMYGLAFEMILSFSLGCHVYFLTRTPSPKIIMDAFAKVQPKLIVTVPLIIEKIIKTRVFPLLEKPMMKVLLHLPMIDSVLLTKIKDKLESTFGGRLQQLIIGGAGLNKDVETFLRRIHFPFTVGYGMTECAPLVAYAPWDEQRLGSCGRIVDRMEARIDSPDGGISIPGTLWVRGDNVMKGYWNNPDATKAAFGADGWMNTGDVCNIDTDGYIYIRGRDKNMILGPSGQNIYPEEIEQHINNLPYVNESLVVEDGDSGSGRLVALIHPDFDALRREDIDTEQIDEMMNRSVRQLNDLLPAYCRVSRVSIMHEEFEKTPKRSIKRYLYDHSN